MAAFAAFLTHAVTVAAPLFAQPQAVPSVSESAPSPQWAAAVDRARPMVRAAVVEQTLPGVSIAVGMGMGIVRAEGFGWRDVVTQTPVTPDTRSTSARRRLRSLPPSRRSG
jgi:CubicO group peptidase (beta-lactamase class C family)